MKKVSILLFLILAISMVASTFPAVLSEDEANNVAENSVVIPAGAHYHAVLYPHNNTVYVDVNVTEAGIYNFTIYIENHNPFSDTFKYAIYYGVKEYNYFLGENESNFDISYSASSVVYGNSNSTISYPITLVNPMPFRVKLSCHYSLEVDFSFELTEKVSDAQELSLGQNTIEFKNIKDTWKIFVADFSDGFYKLDINQTCYGTYAASYLYLYGLDRNLGGDLESFSFYGNRTDSEYLYISFKLLIVFEVYSSEMFNLTLKLNFTKLPVLKFTNEATFTLSKDNPTERKFLVWEMDPNKVYHLWMEYVSGANLSIYLKGFDSYYGFQTIAIATYSNDNNYHYNKDLWGVFLREQRYLYYEDYLGVKPSWGYLMGYPVTNDNGTVYASYSYPLTYIVSNPLSGNKSVFPLVVMPYLYHTPVTEDVVIKIHADVVDTIHGPTNETFSVDKEKLCYRVYNLDAEVGYKYIIKSEVHAFNPSLGTTGIMVYAKGLIVDSSVFPQESSVNDYSYYSYHADPAIYELVPVFPTDSYLVVVYGSVNTTSLKVYFEKYPAMELGSEKTGVLTVTDKMHLYKVEIEENVPYEFKFENYDKTSFTIVMFDEEGRSPFKGFINNVFMFSVTDNSEAFSGLGKAKGVAYILVMSSSLFPSSYKLSLIANNEYYTQGRNLGIAIGFAAGLAIFVAFIVVKKLKR